jgi:hypothetical protein
MKRPRLRLVGGTEYVPNEARRSKGRRRASKPALSVVPRRPEPVISAVNGALRRLELLEEAVNAGDPKRVGFFIHWFRADLELAVEHHKEGAKRDLSRILLDTLGGSSSVAYGDPCGPAPRPEGDTVTVSP